MLELGCKKKIPGSTCEKKWREIAPPNEKNNQAQASMSPISTPALGGMEMHRELSSISDEQEPQDI